MHLQEQEELQEAKERLRSLLVNSSHHRALPLLLLSSLPPALVAQQFQLEQLRAEGRLAEHQVLQVSTDIFDIQLTVAITAAVRELVLQRPCLPGLCRKPLADFVEDFLARCVFQQWFSSRKERRALDLPDRPTGRWPGQRSCQSSHTYLPRSAGLCRCSRLDALKVGLAQDSKLDRQFEARLEAALLQ